jgi:predicted GIY-YIG superfamily endonuclease
VSTSNAGRTAVYRLYGADDQLLYIGCTDDPESRWVQHAGDKSWWPKVTRKAVEWRDTREEALAAEAAAIAGEAPEWNWTHNRIGRERVRREMRERDQACGGVPVDRTIPPRRALPGEYMSRAEIKARAAEAAGDTRGAAYWWSIVQATQQAPPLGPSQVATIRAAMWGGADGQARLEAAHGTQRERAALLRGLSLEEARRLTDSWGIHPSDDQLRQLIAA